jgi:hypothetical protein
MTASPSGLGPVHYRFFDVHLLLEAPREDILRRFEDVYGAFREPSGPGDDRTVRCAIDVDADGRGRVSVDGREHPIATADRANAYAFDLVVGAAAAASQTHLFLHASAVCFGGKAALFAGPSGSGKSTLARMVVGRGGGMIADDVTPVEIGSGAVERFPPWGGLEPIEAEMAVPVGWVFVRPPPPERRAPRLALDRLPEEWGASPPWPATERVAVYEREGYWELAWRARPGPGAMEAVLRACEAAGVLILSRLDRRRPGFGSHPELAPALLGEAAPWIAAELIGRGRREVTGLLRQLASALEGASIWWLAPGPPEETGEAVLRALSGG